jgi:hypothetical protein
LYAAPVSAVVLGLFYYWFAVADRYSVFLYEHLGATPFDATTSSRYWMCGFVAAGIVMLLYLPANWVLGRIAAQRDGAYRPPIWHRVWLICAIPLIIGIPAITMTFNQPVLPLSLALACTVATLAGLALALVPGQWAAQQPTHLAWAIADGAGPMLPLSLLLAVDLPRRGLLEARVAFLVAAGSVVAGMAWLGVMTALRLWRRTPMPGAGALLLAGLSLSYLFLPVVHHLLATPPGYRYITTASNFFAPNLAVQTMALVVAAAMALGFVRVRQSIQLSRRPAIR